jgi:hypothetical protein
MQPGHLELGEFLERDDLERTELDLRPNDFTDVPVQRIVRINAGDSVTPVPLALCICVLRGPERPPRSARGSTGSATFALTTPLRPSTWIGRSTEASSWFTSRPRRRSRSRAVHAGDIP